MRHIPNKSPTFFSGNETQLKLPPIIAERGGSELPIYINQTDPHSETARAYRDPKEPLSIRITSSFNLDGIAATDISRVKNVI